MHDKVSERCLILMLASVLPIPKHQSRPDVSHSNESFAVHDLLDHLDFYRWTLKAVFHSKPLLKLLVPHFLGKRTL